MRTLVASFKFFSLLSLFALVFSNVEANINQIEIRILPESVVYGQSYSLGDVAEIDGFDVELIQKLAKVKLGLSPLPGKSHMLTKRKVKSHLNKDFRSVDFRIVMPTKPMVSRASIKIKSKELERIVLKEIKERYKDYEEVNVEIKTRIKDQFIPKGKPSYQFKRIGKTDRIGGYSSWNLILETDEKEVKKLLIRTKIEVVDHVLVAKSRIPRGEKIEKEDLKKIKKNISKEKPGFENKQDIILGQQAKRDIFENESLKPNLVEQPVLVQKGSPVKVVYRTDKLHFTNLAIAIKSGRRGETIPVKTLDGKTTIFVTVIDEKNVEVAL